ncbi:MAG: DUF6599 family protein [Pyrinomonadaceae bacterium]
MYFIHLFKLSAVGLLLFSLLLVESAAQVPSDDGAKTLPDRVGEFTARQPSRTFTLTFAPLTEEDFQIVSSGEREYTSADGTRYLIRFFNTRSNSAAYALLTRLTDEQAFAAAPESLGVLGVSEPNRIRFVKGTTLIDVFNSGTRTDGEALASFARLLREIPEGAAGELPVLVQHLPDFEKVSETTSYAVSLPALQSATGSRPVLDALSFDGGTEAVTATYGDTRLVIVEFTTPQYAADNDARVTQRIAQLRAGAMPTPSAYQRIGNYSVFVFDAPDEVAARNLLGGVKYEKEVRWLGRNPRIHEQAVREYSVTMGGAILASFKITALSLLLSLGMGGIIGGAIFLMRRRALDADGAVYSDAGGMVRLNLDKLQAEKNPARLLGSRHV